LIGSIIEPQGNSNPNNFNLAYVYKDYQIDAGNPRSVFHSAGFGRPALDLHSQVQKELLDTFIDAVINET